jgi:hypothetical protein
LKIKSKLDCGAMGREFIANEYNEISPISFERFKRLDWRFCAHTFLQLTP